MCLLSITIKVKVIVYPTFNRHVNVEKFSNISLFIFYVWPKDVDDSIYPPQKKGFRLLQYWCEHYLETYDWFIKVDDDTYLKVLSLEKLLSGLDENEMVCCLYFINCENKTCILPLISSD